jgi:hypothetical protein
MVFVKETCFVPSACSASRESILAALKTLRMTARTMLASTQAISNKTPAPTTFGTNSNNWTNSRLSGSLGRVSCSAWKKATRTKIISR